MVLPLTFPIQSNIPLFSYRLKLPIKPVEIVVYDCGVWRWWSVPWNWPVDGTVAMITGISCGGDVWWVGGGGRGIGVPSWGWGAASGAPVSTGAKFMNWNVGKLLYRAVPAPVCHHFGMLSASTGGRVAMESYYPSVQWPSKVDPLWRSKVFVFFRCFGGLGPFWAHKIV